MDDDSEPVGNLAAVIEGTAYLAHFGLREAPFTITPDPRYLYMSERHREALAHLLFGVGELGGFVQLTGEVGTGKTTLCRALLEQLPEQVDVALVLNPWLTSAELLGTVCDELGIAVAAHTTSVKPFVDALYRHLLDAHARGRRTVVIVDEAQDLSAEVLEQIRLLTNLETTREKLLQIILIGQPELITLLEREDLRQLAQRITARYHLEPFAMDDTRAYIRHRLQIAGRTRGIFSDAAIRAVHAASRGIPRLINVICDRALLGAFAHQQTHVDARMVKKAAAEIRGPRPRRRWLGVRPWIAARPWVAAAAAAAVVAIGVGVVLSAGRVTTRAAPRAAGARSIAAAPTSTAPTARTSTPTVAVAQATTPAASPASPVSRASTVAPAVVLPPASPVARAATSVVPPAAAVPPAATTVVAPASPARPVAPVSGAERAVPAPAAATVKLADLLRDPAIRSDERSAFEAVFRRWGVEHPEVTAQLACDGARAEKLRCFTRTGTWAGLRRYNVPAVLELTSAPGTRHHAALMALSEQTATLDVGGRAFTVPLAEVQSLWNGTFTLVWRPPGLHQVPIVLGMRGKEVEWVRQRLAIVEGQPAAGVGSDVYDAELKDRVVSFQKSRSLQADGIVGEETVLHLVMASRDQTVPLLAAAGR